MLVCVVLDQAQCGMDVVHCRRYTGSISVCKCCNQRLLSFMWNKNLPVVVTSTDVSCSAVYLQLHLFASNVLAWIQELFSNHPPLQGDYEEPFTLAPSNIEILDNINNFRTIPNKVIYDFFLFFFCFECTNKYSAWLRSCFPGLYSLVSDYMFIASKNLQSWKRIMLFIQIWL